ncbi:MAG: hypothetical protein QT09_C0005G0049 [archaeon GW2011_AR18]|nr:MAG: hypothetical protein QT09_C0005G0049 [archaeon GW2011_AR18]
MFNSFKEYYLSMKDKKYFVEIVIKKEKLSDNKLIFVANCPSLNIASQGKSTEEAINNIKEAIELYLEEQPEKFDELYSGEPPLFSVIEVTKNAKASNSIR